MTPSYKVKEGQIGGKIVNFYLRNFEDLLYEVVEDEQGEHNLKGEQHIVLHAHVPEQLNRI